MRRLGLNGAGDFHDFPGRGARRGNDESLGLFRARMEQDFALCGVAVDDLLAERADLPHGIDVHFHDHHVEVVVAEDARELLAYGTIPYNNDALCAFRWESSFSSRRGSPMPLDSSQWAAPLMRR